MTEKNNDRKTLSKGLLFEIGETENIMHETTSI